MTESQLYWRTETNGYYEQPSDEDRAEYQEWLDTLPADLNDAPPDNPEDALELPPIDANAIPF
jgi:hypothetical protein